MIEAIVFDAFGTLVTAVSPSGPYQALGRESGGDPRAFRRLALTADIPISELASSLGARDPERYSRILEEDLAGCSLYPDATEAIGLLARAGNLGYAVCSNLAHGYGKVVRQLVPGAKAHVFSFEVAACKPDPAIYKAVADALEVEPSRILFLGDTPNMDVVGPKAFGMQAALVDRKRGVDLVTVLSSRLRLLQPASSVACTT